jgi:hypothetical protein
MPMKKSDIDFENSFVHIPDSKTPSGIGDMPMTELASSPSTPANFSVSFCELGASNACIAATAPCGIRQSSSHLGRPYKRLRRSWQLWVVANVRVSKTCD